jgi:hypothetical protein
LSPSSGLKYVGWGIGWTEISKVNTLFMYACVIVILSCVLEGGQNMCGIYSGIYKLLWIVTVVISLKGFLASNNGYDWTVFIIFLI